MADLPGRAQIVSDPDICTQGMNSGLVFYLDGAHSPESLEVCARWFSNVVKDEAQSDPESSRSCKYKQAGNFSPYSYADSLTHMVLKVPLGFPRFYLCIP